MKKTENILSVHQFDSISWNKGFDVVVVGAVVDSRIA